MADCRFLWDVLVDESGFLEGYFVQSFIFDVIILYWFCGGDNKRHFGTLSVCDLLSTLCWISAVAILESIDTMTLFHSLLLSFFVYLLLMKFEIWLTKSVHDYLNKGWNNALYFVRWPFVFCVTVTCSSLPPAEYITSLGGASRCSWRLCGR